MKKRFFYYRTEVGELEREELEEGVTPTEMEAVLVVLLVLEFVDEGHLEGDSEGNKEFEGVLEGLTPEVSEAVGVLEGVRVGVIEPVMVFVGDTVGVIVGVWEGDAPRVRLGVWEGVRELVGLRLCDIVGD